MSAVLIVHSGDRNGILAAALLRAKLGRGDTELHRADTLLRLLKRHAQSRQPVDVYVVGLTVRPKDGPRLARVLEAFARRDCPVRWISHRSLPAEAAEAVARFGHKEGSFDPTRTESVSLVRERLRIRNATARLMEQAARSPETIEADIVQRWLYALDRVEDAQSRHPGYLQALMARLTKGFPKEMNAIDKALYSEGATAARRSRERAQGFIWRQVHAGEANIAIADLRGERSADWRLVAGAIVGREGRAIADIGVVLALDGSVKLRARDGLVLDDLLRDAANSERFPDFLPDIEGGAMTTRPGVVGYGRHEDRSELEKILSALQTALDPSLRPAPKEPERVEELVVAPAVALTREVPEKSEGGLGGAGHPVRRGTRLRRGAPSGSGRARVRVSRPCPTSSPQRPPCTVSSRWARTSRQASGSRSTATSCRWGAGSSRRPCSPSWRRRPSAAPATST